MNNPVPITIISGFLGAGKTTLLNNILNTEHGHKIAVLVNDFGEINVDSELIVGLENEVDNTISFSNGCICCSLRDDMLESILELLERPEPPDYIVIEASGVSDPAAIALSLLMPGMRDLIRVENIITVVDAEQVTNLVKGANAELGIAQISIADILVLNKTDLVRKEKLTEIKGGLSEILPGLRLVECAYGRVPMELVFGIGGYNPDRLLYREPIHVHVHSEGSLDTHDAKHDHGNVFSTWNYTTDKILSYERVRKAVKSLPTSIFRAKGILYLDTFPDLRGILHVVGKRCALSWDKPWNKQTPYSRFVLIGTPEGVDPEMLQSHFERCLGKDTAGKLREAKKD